jgi:hypothetical protein
VEEMQRMVRKDYFGEETCDKVPKNLRGPDSGQSMLGR